MDSSSSQLQQPTWMSWWDKYFAPGDVRRQKQLESTTPSATESPSQEQQRPAPVIPQRIDAAHRARRQNALLFGGLAFTCLSLFVTRRALRRKLVETYPKQFTPSNETPKKVDGGIEAIEALFLATLNVGSIFMLGTGAAMKYFDVADVEDMRDAVRKGIGYDVYAGDSEADKELEAWVADVLSKKDGGIMDLKDNISQKLQELAEMEQKKQEQVKNSAILQELGKK